MKTRMNLLILLNMLAISLIVFQGCYTQLSSTRDEKEGSDEYVSEEGNEEVAYEDEAVNAEQPSDEYYENSGCCDDSYRPQVGFSYYYPSHYWPSSAFSIAYNNPWYYDYYSYSYDPWYSPYWGYNSWYYTPGYSPYYSYYPYYSWGWYYGSDGYARNSGARNFGAVRAGGARGGADIINNNAASGTRVDLPTGARVGRTSGGSAATRSTSATRANTRQNSNVRERNVRDSRTNQTRATTSRGINQRNEGARTSQPQSRPPGVSAQPTRTGSPSGNSSGNSGQSRRDNNGGSSRGSAPNYTPPPQPSSPPPSHSSPPPSSGGRSDGNSGGSSRGRRP